MSDDLQRLVDHADIVDVCVRYALAIDMRDWDLLRSCFAAEFEWDFHGVPHGVGYEALEQLIRSVVAKLDRSQHLLGNHHTEIDGTRAFARCYFQAQHVREAAPGRSTYVVAGTYTDRFVRSATGWKIAHRRLDVWWDEGNRAVSHPDEGAYA